jgi:hypothetical protein
MLETVSIQNNLAKDLTRFLFGIITDGRAKQDFKASNWQ